MLTNNVPSTVAVLDTLISWINFTSQLATAHIGISPTTILYLVGAILAAAVAFVMHRNVNSLRARISDLNEAGALCGTAIFVEGGHLAKTTGAKVPPYAGRTAEYDLATQATAGVSRELTETRRLLNKALSGRRKALFLFFVSAGLLVCSLL